MNNEINPENIKLKFSKDKEKEIFINHNLYKYLTDEKRRINNYSSEWENMKKYKNPYEFIHTSLPFQKKSISKYKPLSRAFFKMIEICNTFNLLQYYRGTIRSFHLAEGPGGFIEALQYLRNNNEDIYFGMTLIDSTNTNVPGWRKIHNFLNSHKNVILEYGKDKRGDLYNPENFLYCIEKYKNSMDIITGDGGFDFSINYDEQEAQVLKLIFCQIAYAIALQKKGGTFILKIFDVFLQSSVELIYILSCLYKKVHIIKPNTSRYANSEKYIVCEQYILEDSSSITKKLHSILVVLNNMKTDTYRISSFINFSMQSIYLDKLKEINCILGQQQIETITSTLNLIEQTKTTFSPLVKEKNIQKCIHWCQKNNIPYFKNIYI